MLALEFRDLSIGNNGLEDTALATCQTEINLGASVLITHGSLLYPARQRIEEISTVGFGCQSDPSINTLVLQTGDEVMISGDIVATDELESMQCGHILGDNLRELLQRRDILIGTIHRDDGCSEDLPFLQTSLDVVGKHPDLGQNQCLVAHTTWRDDVAIVIDTSDVENHAVGAIVHVVARVVDSIDRMDKAGCLLCHRMDIELQKTARIFLDNVIERKIDEQVIVGLSILHPRLNTRHILEEGRRILPDRVDG